MASERTPVFCSYTPTQLRELYGNNPDLFEQLAAEAIMQACIGSTPEQTLRLRHLQWVIDSRLRKGKTPREKLRIMENIFYDQIYGGKGHLSQLSSCWAELHSSIKAIGRAGAGKPVLRLVTKKSRQLE